MELVNVNGLVVGKSRAFLRIDDHSYRYGYGLFETMKVVNGELLLADLHFERLFQGLATIQVTPPPGVNEKSLYDSVIELCKINQCESLARVRLSVSPGHGNINESESDFQYLIECRRLHNTGEQNGLTVDVFPDAYKARDKFSNLKSASFLPYVMASKFSKANNLDDALVLNDAGRIADSTIANIFWIKDGTIFTPPLSEGCVAGVMRKYLLERLRLADYDARQKECNITDLENADEVFLTNVIKGARCVKAFRGRSYSCKIPSGLENILKIDTIA